MARPLWFVQMIKDTFSQRFMLAKLTRFRPLRWIIDRLLFHEDRIFYLPKAETISVNRDIEREEDTVLPTKVIEHFIDKSDKRWIMNFCICRSSSDCQDFPQEIGCLFLGDAVTNINPKLGRLASKDEAHAHMKKAADEGMVHLIGRNKLDVMWLDAGPGEKLMTICNCCPCCCLWKVIPDIHPEIGGKVTKMPGVHVSVNHELCTGCGQCSKPEVCFVKAISLKDKKSHISDACRGCGRCVEICPSNAITLDITSPEIVEETINHLSPLVDVGN